MVSMSRMLVAAACLGALASLSGAFEVEMSDQEKCLTEAISEGSIVFATWYTLNRTNNQRVSMQSVTVTSPSGKSEYSENNKADGFFAFHSKETGAYRACFRANTQGDASQTKIGLTWHVGMQVDNWNKLVDKEHMDVLVAKLGELELMADSLYEEVTWIREKEQEMRDLNESINTKVAFFSVATLAISIMLSIGQLFYLRRFFKAKKVL